MPTLATLRPTAVLPGGEIEVLGADLQPTPGSEITADVSGVAALVTLARAGSVRLRLPEGTLPGNVIVHRNGQDSNPLPIHVAVAMAENLHPVANPAVDPQGNVYATLSGQRGQRTPVSVFRIANAPSGITHDLRPYVRDILNPTGLAFGPDGLLYVSSRAEGIVYRVGTSGVAQVYAEGLGIATGIAFDEAGDLYVGDRSGTIFKIRAERPGQQQETFVFATLEPSISAYHLAFHPDGTLFVTGPTTASSQSIYAVAPDGTARIFFRGLGRAQGLAVDPAGDLYVAASYRGDRGIFRVSSSLEVSLAISGNDIVGLCFLPGNRAAVATRDAVYEVAL